MGLNTLFLAHKFVSEHVKEGDFCIDATAGKGRDTLILSTLVGDFGKVYAFDIQAEAIKATDALLKNNGRKNVTLINESHHKMDEYVKKAKAVDITSDVKDMLKNSMLRTLFYQNQKDDWYLRK